jgi:predicted XRE-type DNA-binding protein
MKTRSKRSSGNVFLDIGFPPYEAQNLRVRADLMIELIRIVRSRKLTQATASKLLGVTQPRVSDLMTGKIDRFSIDALVEMLARAGRRVEIATKPSRRVA